MMQIESLFAVPLLSTVIPNSEALNAQLEALFKARALVGPRYQNIEPQMRIQPGVFESEFDLFSWQEPCVAALAQICVRALWQTVVLMTGANQAQLDRLEMKLDAWFHLTETGGYHALHNHPNATWSGVYCVNPGDASPSHIDSGVLSLLNPLSMGNMFLDYSNHNLVSPFSLNGHGVKFVPGQLVIFPSWLWHQAMPYFGKKTRITVAFNAWFPLRA